MLSDLSDWVVDVIDRLGYVGVALLVALENLFPPIPSEIVLPFAGFVAALALLWGSGVTWLDLGILAVMYVLVGFGEESEIVADAMAAHGRPEGSSAGE